MDTTQTAPVTTVSLRGDLDRLGVAPGSTLVVHSSLSSLGWVAGGAQAVVDALLAAVGPEGTLVLPTHTTHLTEPALWGKPPVPADWWPVIREQTPAFDPALTPTFLMGAVPECFRRYPGVRRSSHPTVSFAARGPAAEQVTAGHSLDDGVGEASPLARVYDLDGSVLLLGVGHRSNSSLHLSEYRAEHDGKLRLEQGSPVLVDGERRWVRYTELQDDLSDFERLGAAFALAGGTRCGPVGGATATLMSQRALVDFGAQWMSATRGQATS
jgi:aminoglycoside 3-N-acetyltransferase